MRTLSGCYDLDDASSTALRARRLRLLQRGTSVTGRFGRRGVVNGHAGSCTLTAVVRDDGQIGVLELTFDAALFTFAGTLRHDADSVAVGGRRTERRRRPAPP
jgi:hypothetical protein